MSDNTDWIKLDRSIVDVITSETVHGVNIQVGVSPYDRPIAARGLWPAGNKFRLEFRYLGGDEASVEVIHQGPAKFFVNHKTQRLCAVEFDLSQLPGGTVRAVQVAVGEAIEKLERGSSFAHGSTNLQSARRALTAVEELVPDSSKLAAAGGAYRGG